MKNLIRIFIFYAICFSSPITVSAPLSFTGKVYLLNAANSEYYQTPIIHTVQIAGMSSASSCFVQNGMVLIRLPEDPEVYATFLAAKTARMDVMVHLDDTYKDNTGSCILKFVTLF